MQTIADLIRLSPVVYTLITVLDSLVHLTGCAFVTVALFRLPLRRPPVPYLLCVLLCAAAGVADALLAGTTNDFVAFLWSVAAMALPYVCLALLFWGKGVWKSFLVGLGYTFVEAARFLILLLFFRFDNDNRDDALELIVGFLVDVVCFLLAYVLLTRYAKKRTIYLNVTKNAVVLFVLLVASVVVFVTSLLLIGSHYSGGSQLEFGFMLMNIPVLTATVSFALLSFFRMRSRSEQYKQQLNMQIRQYEWMEQMNEELRMFRHDFPKKMRPLIAYLDEDKPEEAREMAERFSDFVSNTGARFHTGNYRLDTVLFCEQQIAQRDGIRLDVPFDTAFPKEGIDPDDIYTIFPNVLDNAIEATRKAAGEKVITFRSHRTKQTVYITIRNPVSGEVETENGLPRTSKADKAAHGYGFRSMKKAAAKYGDDNVNFTVKDGVFELQIFLNVPETAQNPSEAGA